jgi:hypothetical protein
MDTDVRGEPTALDAAWMTAGLAAAGVARGATVTELEFAGYVGTGQMSRNGRFLLAWDDPNGRPVSVIGKFPSADESTRVGSFESGVYLSEVAFYRDVAATVNVRTPVCWVARINEVQREFVLIMEDLAGSVQGDQFSGCSPDQVDLALAQAVALHAPRWGDRGLAQLTALQPAGEQRAQMFASYYRAAVGGCLERLGWRLDADVAELVQRFERLVECWTRGSGTAHTVVHGDFRPDNFLFGQVADAPPLAVVDWQTVQDGLGVTDVAYLLGGALDPDLRRDVEQEMVDDYRHQLNAAGVVYSAADCWRDYQWSTLHGVLIGVAASMMAEQTERGDEMLTLMVNRHARHAIDLEALALVETAAP